MGNILAAIRRPFTRDTLRRLAEPNPMMFKELTQGIRNNGFLSLFFLLLVASWITLLTVMMMARNVPSIDGFHANRILLLMLSLYAIIIGARAYGLTVKEVENRTFELYLLAGMSPERLVWGKLATCLYLYGFGFSIIAPFMLSSYFLSGVDFYMVLTLLVFLTIIAALFYGYSVLAALVRSLTQVRTIVSLAYYASLFAIAGFCLAWVGMGRGETQMLTQGLQWLFTGEGYQTGLVLLGFYSLLVISLFFICSHLVCSESDTREHIIKSLVVMLLGFIIGLTIYFPNEEGIDVLSYFFSYIILGLGLVFWVNHDEVPSMFLARRAKVSRFIKPYYYLFEPGRRGTGRLLMLLAPLVPITVFIVYTIRLEKETFRILYGRDADIFARSLVPFVYLAMLVMHDSLFKRSKKMKQNPGVRRSSLTLYWAFSAIASWLLLIQFVGTSSATTWDRYPIPGFVVGLFITPVITFPALDGITSIPPGFMTLLIFGIFAYYLLIKENRRIAHEERERGNALTAAPILEPASVSPELLEAIQSAAEPEAPVDETANSDDDTEPKPSPPQPDT
jgi:hypothetical protein